MPDTVVMSVDENELIYGLINQDMYFKYADKYVAEHPDGSSFAMNDEIIGGFYSFLNQEQFEYSTKAESELLKLKEIVSKDGYSDRTKQFVDELESELKSERLREFDKSKPIISRELTKEILRKYNKPYKEITEAGLKDDAQLQAALSIIKNSALYDRFLR